MQAKKDAFDAHHVRYETWFTHHEDAYHSEILWAIPSLKRLRTDRGC